MNKLALILILALPLFATDGDQSSDIPIVIPTTGENLDWTVPESRGLLLEVNGDSLCYEERWMHLLPGSSDIANRSDETIAIDGLRAPCVVDISYGGKGKLVYVIRLRVVTEPLPRDVNGDIVVPDHIYE